MLTNWDFFYVSSHGSLENRLMIVPPNTYILNLATAGKSCPKIRWRIDNWIYDYEEPKPAFNRRVPILHKLHEAIIGKTFLRGVGPEETHVYTPGTTAQNIEEQYTSAEGAEGFHERTLAFYQPGDILFDTKLSFHNNYLPILLLGAYRIPIPYKLRKALFNINKVMYSPEAIINSLQNTDLIGLPQGSQLGLATPAHNTMFNIPENLIQAEMFPAVGVPKTDFYLSDVIKFINTTQTEKPEHVFIVDACRSAATEPLSKRMRRFSISARENRERVNINAAIIAAKPSKKWRTTLNKTLLENLRRAFTNNITALQKDLVPLQQKKRDAAKKPTFAERLKADSEAQAEIDKVNLDIQGLQQGIQNIDRILAQPLGFTMEDIQGILTIAKSALQPEFKALFGIE